MVVRGVRRREDNSEKQRDVTENHPGRKRDLPPCRAPSHRACAAVYDTHCRPMRKLTLAAAAATLAFTLGARAEVEPKNFDLSVKPQDDFYRYVNGTWLKNNPIPADQSRWGGFNQLIENNQASLKTICDRVSKSDAPPGSIERQVGDFYASGMDEGAVNAAGTSPLQPELDRLAVVKSPADILKAIAHLQSFGAGCGFRFGSGPDQKQSDIEIAQLGQGGLGLPERGYYFDDDEKSQKTRQQYLAHMINMFVLLGESRDSATVSAQAVLALETRLALNSLRRVDMRDPYRSYHKMKLSEAAAKTPGIDFKLFFAERGAPAFEEVNLAHPEFFVGFESALKEIPASTWQAYLRWHLVRYAAPYLSDPFVKESFEFNDKILTGLTEQKPRWKRALDSENRAIGMILGRLFVKEYFPESAKKRYNDLVEAMLLAIDNPAAQQQLFNIAMTEPVDYGAVAQRLERTRGMQPVRINTPLHSNLLDNAKARLQLGWTPRVDTAALVDRAFDYVRAADDPRKVWYVG